MAISLKFQKRLIELSDDYGYSRSELKEKIKVSSSLNNALNYGIIPTPKTLIKIADFFSVSLSYLLAYDDENNFIPSAKPISFQKRFNELCKEKSITYYRVAADGGFDNCLISRWMKKDFLPSLEIAEVLSDYFKVSLDYLFGRSDYRN